MFNDAQRINRIKFLIDSGFGDKIVVGHDIHTKHVLVSMYIITYTETTICTRCYVANIFLIFISYQVKYGGHGYGHFLESVVPKMIDRGIPMKMINKMTVETPRDWLKFI